MYILYAPPRTFGQLAPGSIPITPDVKFYNNVAYCPKFFWYKQHITQGFIDLTPRWMQRLRKKRTLNSILFISTGGFGDVMWSMPVIREVRSLYPKARIFVATNQRTLHLFDNFPYADVFLPYDFFAIQGLIHSCDEVFDFGGIATFLKKEMSMEPVEACFYHVSIDPPKNKNFMLPHIVLTIDEGKSAKSFLLSKGIDVTNSSLISMSAESSTPNRNYPTHYLYDLALALQKDGHQVVILSESGSFRDRSSSTCTCGYEFDFTSSAPPLALTYQCPVCKSYRFIDQFGLPAGICDLSGLTTFRQALAVIAMSNLFVGPASSLVIASTSLSIPTIGLYGAFDPHRLSKYYHRFSFLYKKIKCSNCSEHWTECRFGYPSPCMKLLTPPLVYERIKYMLTRYPRQPISRIPFE